MPINKVAVIGAGLMGSGIAAQVANAGHDVVLLDIVPEDAGEGREERSRLALSALDKMQKASPAPLMKPSNIRRITPGNMEDDLHFLEGCDWIVEAVLEDLEVKKKTYAKIEKHRKSGAIISSNTSTIPLDLLTDGRSEDFTCHFLITHFFNPPRYMRLLELVTGDKTDAKAIEDVTQFCDRKLGKGVVPCHDTPAFIVNRLLVYWMQVGLNEAIEQDIPVELADAVLSKPLGIPKTGLFGLMDLVGIDLMPHLAGSLLSTLPEDDPYRREYQDYPFITQMIEPGYTGRKGEGGFYRLHKDGNGGKVKQALKINPDTFDPGSQYNKAGKPAPDAAKAGKKGLRAVVESDDSAGRYAWAVMAKTLHYAASLVPEIADTVHDVDRAMQMGCNWKMGPFEMIDQLGPAWFAGKLADEGYEIPALLKQVGEGSFYTVIGSRPHYFGTDGQYHPVERPEGVLILGDIKMASEPVYKTRSAALWDVGEGVLCLEFTAKMNALDHGVFEVIHKAIELIGDGTGDYRGLVIHNEGSHFSAGANLSMALEAIDNEQWDDIDALVKGGQDAYMALKYAPFPVIAAPSGMALGGGCEILLHSDHVQAHAETYCGLVEVGVGLVPAWGGCKEMILRLRRREQELYDSYSGGGHIWFSPKHSPMKAIREAYQIIGTAKVAGSADDAKKIGYMRAEDGTTMNRDRLLFDARAKVQELAAGYTPPLKAADIPLPGPSGKAAMDMAVEDYRKSGKATPYDVVVSEALSTVLSGGEAADWTAPLSEDDILALERDQFMQLVKTQGTRDRIAHMLETGKPLRN